MKAFDEWKERMEAAASKFCDPEAANAAALQQGIENYEQFMGTIQGYMQECNDSALPEHQKIRLMVGFLQAIVDNMTAGCKLFTQRYPEEGEAILDFYQSHIEFFENMIADLEAGVVVDANHGSREEEQ
jgi:hypothetical protein